MGFQLLQDNVMYRKVVTTTGGSFVSGLWVEGIDVVTYTPFSGEYEPFSKSQNSIILPAGVSSSDAILIYTNVTDLKTANDLNGRATNPDVVYLTDPTADSTIVDAYEIEDKEFWQKNTGFSLLTDDYGYYLALRKAKGEG